MSSLSDAEIIAALPLESRQKINNAFEALSQSSPSPAEQVILYRVAHTLKLNPTDTVFSVMAAMHYYLQLYQTIPSKIANAGGEIRQAGADVDTAIRKATAETLREHSDALNAQAELVAAQNQKMLIDNVGKIAQKIAGDSAASERQKSFAWAAGSMTVFGACMYAAGLALGSKALDGVGWGYLTMLPLMVGIAGGMVLCVALFYGDRFKLKEENSVQHQDATTAPEWTELEVNLVSKRAHMSDRNAKACWDVLSGNLTIDDAASKHKIFKNYIEKRLKILEENR